MLESLLRTLLRSVRLHDPLGVNPIFARPSAELTRTRFTILNLGLSHEIILYRANRFAIDIPIFIARQADSPESLEFPIRANHPIRANRANRFARITPLRFGTSL